MLLNKILDWLDRRLTPEPDDQKNYYTIWDRLDKELEDRKDQCCFSKFSVFSKGERWYDDDRF